MNNEMEQIIDANRVMDVRPIPCSIKHGLIIRTWEQLPLGEHFILLNDHDPVPLRYQFAAEYPNAFTWEYLERGGTFGLKLRRPGTACGIVNAARALTVALRTERNGR
jgi:uncharacterized protein (DUF2249 family)